MTTPEQLTWLFIPTAAGLGAIHAMEPGHGKTMMAIYLAGNRGTVANAVMMGIVVTITHTFTIFVLALASVFAAAWLPMDRLQFGLEIAATGMLIGLGLWLVVVRTRELMRSEVDEGHHDHGWGIGRHAHGHHHDHHHSHDHDHDHDHDHNPNPNQPTDHVAAPPARGMRPGEVLTMGISAGLVPCPGAMAVFLIGVSSGQYLLGLATVTAFSIGLAAALVAIGIVVVLSTTAAARATSGWRWTRLLPLATAIIVTVLGVVMLWRAVVSPHSHEDHSHLMRSPLVANIST